MTVVAIEADIHNCPTPDGLWDLLEHAARDIAAVTELGDVNKRPGIKATRDVYKALGKEPNRYRPSSEALTRRAVKGMELYRINAVVDLINLVSLLSGYSIGGFDAGKIDGDTLTLGVGREGEPFDAIGRGPLNISHMPVYRDNIGGVGTPTSDNERTKLNKLGGTEWAKTTRKAKAAAKDLAEGLIRLYAQRQRLAGHAFSPDSPLRGELEAELARLGGAAMLAQLAQVDPETAARLHPNDHKRIVRALEVFRSTGRTISQHDRETRALPPRYDALTIGLTFRDREDMKERIDRRVDAMVAQGLLQEEIFKQAFLLGMEMQKDAEE